jgi:hypothetical protein
VGEISKNPYPFIFACRKFKIITAAFIRSVLVDFLMREDNSILNLLFYVKTITFLMIGIIIVTGISVSSLIYMPPTSTKTSK